MSPSEPPTEQVTLARGATIGRFVVLGLVGRGGMGEVYAAYDPELDRKVAVKLLRIKPGAGVSQTEGRARTLREAQAIARLSHPNVVVVYDVGTFEDKVFIAMEFVEGNTVSYWVQSQPRSWQDILAVFIAAGRGLAAAHEKGLVHRDFKPENVMVGKDEQVRVMDFGLARAAPERSGRGPAGGSAERATPSGARSRARSGEMMPPGGDVVATTTPALGLGLGGRGDSGAGVRESGARVPSDPGTRVRGDTSLRRGTPRFLRPLDLPSTPDSTPPSAAPGAEAVPRTIDPNSTMVLSVPAKDGIPEGSGSGNRTPFDVRLTRTGAMMGTPAYMAPEQFLGTPNDPRTDQFAFCIALYESLYGERPFAGNTMYTLTTNVVQGNVRPAPANTKVPAWIRKILLRGLRPNADDRWPSMEGLLGALGRNPAAIRKKWLQIAVVPLALVASGIWVQQTRADRRAVCTGGPSKLAGAWELRNPGEGESERQSQIHRGFLATGKGYAADVFATVNRALTGYAQAWVKMHREACEATQIRKEQSTDVMDLRMACLQERLGELRALSDVFAEPTGDIVENAASAASALGSLDRCADVPLLRAVVAPPEDKQTREQVAKLRDRLAGVKARVDAGSFREAMDIAPGLVEEARRVGYKPLVAEALSLLGFVLWKRDDAPGAERAYIDGFYVAEASRHDEIRASIATSLTYVAGYQEGNYSEGERWAKIAEAVLSRLGGHDLLRAWLLNDLGGVYYARGDFEAAASLMEKALGLKAKVLGPDDPDLGRTEGNIAIALGQRGRYEEALDHVQRSIQLLQGGLGSAHPDTVFQICNRGDILNAMGRPADARASFETARSVWERELGQDSRNMAYALTGIGLSFLAESNAAEAIPPLERAMIIRQTQEGGLAKRAETAFALARALWDSDKDRGRAVRLAEGAAADYKKVRSDSEENRVEKWIRSRHGSSDGSRLAVRDRAH